MSTQPDLTAYLGRVGVRAAPPSEAALAELLGAHVRTFSFDNLDILLGRQPGVELAAVEEKFVGRGRGGYCFEHSTLFGAVLTALGYDAALHLGRVHDPAVAGRTHLVVVVALEGRRLLLDPGFGSSSLVPVPLEDRAVVDGGLHRHRMVRVGEERRRGTPPRRRDLDLDELPTHLGDAGLTSETGRLLDRVRELRAAT